MRHLGDSDSETERSMEGARGRGVWCGVRSYCFMGTEFQFGKTTKFCRRMGAMGTPQCNVSVLKATELCT